MSKEDAAVYLGISPRQLSAYVGHCTLHEVCRWNSYGGYTSYFLVKDLDELKAKINAKQAKLYRKNKHAESSQSVEDTLRYQLEGMVRQYCY
jgi:hypothetical protein